MSAVIHASVWLAAIGCGVMAGIYFAFSIFVMKALGTIPRPAGIAAMQSINEVIVASPFLPLFMLTSLLSLALAGWSIGHWEQPGSAALLAAGALYFVGMFLCTVAFNVPLNNALAAVDPASAEAATLWSRYLRDWTLWNHVRTVASTVACGGFVWVLTKLS